MKKITVIGMALVLAASAASAKSLTVIHSQTGEGTTKDAGSSIGIFAQEIRDAAAAAGMQLSEITEITVISAKLEKPEPEEGEEPAEDEYALFNEYDIYDFRAFEGGMFKTHIVKVDFSQLVCADHHLPTNDPPYLYGKNGTFAQFTKLTDCILPEDLTAIPGGAFYGCSNLVNLNLPPGLITIPQDGFGNCAKLKLSTLPPDLKNIYSGAFAGCTAVTFSEMPSGVKEILANAFNECSNVTFSELPDCVTLIGEKAFRATNVTISKFPGELETLEKAVFVNAPITEFTIDDVAGLWNTIPDQTFWLGDVDRTFVCRSPIPPKAAVEGTNTFTGVFGGSKSFPKITMKVLESALPLYQTTAPYSTMKLEVLTTTAPESDSSIDYESFPEEVEIKEGDIALCYEVNGKFFSSLSEAEVPESAENAAFFNVWFQGSAPENIYVKEIRFAPETTKVQARAEELIPNEEPEPEEEDADVYDAADEEETGEIDDPDKDVLYRASTTDREAVSIPVTISPNMRPLQVVIGQSANGTITGVDSVDARESFVSRRGNTINLSRAGASLYDLAGRVVASTEGTSISMDQLPGGVYILRAGNTVQKIVK